MSPVAVCRWGQPPEPGQRCTGSTEGSTAAWGVLGLFQPRFPSFPHPALPARLPPAFRHTARKLYLQHLLRLKSMPGACPVRYRASEWCWSRGRETPWDLQRTQSPAWPRGHHGRVPVRARGAQPGSHTPSCAGAAQHTRPGTTAQSPGPSPTCSGLPATVCTASVATGCTAGLGTPAGTPQCCPLRGWSLLPPGVPLAVPQAGGAGLAQCKVGMVQGLQRDGAASAPQAASEASAPVLRAQCQALASCRILRQVEVGPCPAMYQGDAHLSPCAAAAPSIPQGCTTPAPAAPDRLSLLVASTSHCSQGLGIRSGFPLSNPRQH